MCILCEEIERKLQILRIFLSPREITLSKTARSYPISKKLNGSSRWTDRPTDRPTDRQTDSKAICPPPFFEGRHNKMDYYEPKFQSLVNGV